MARRSALLRLGKTLRARRAELNKKLAGESASLHDFEAVDATGDSADAAFERESGEMSGQLQDLEARELRQIERALLRLQQAAFGICENCQKQIPLARLNVLPYATLCIKCERDRETHSGGRHWPDADNWTQLVDADSGMRDRRINLTEVERSYG
jgi:RNA polymerase-binding transcription factor